METIQAVKAQLLASQRAVVPIVPLSEIGRVFNLCQVDNFDRKVEGQEGKNLTNLCYEQILVTKMSKLVLRNDGGLAKDIFVNSKVEPPCILSNVMIDARHLIDKYYFWTWLTVNNVIDQTIHHFLHGYYSFATQKISKRL